MPVVCMDLSVVLYMLVCCVDSGMEAKVSRVLRDFWAAAVGAAPPMWPYLDFSVDIPDRVLAPLTLRLLMMKGSL